MRTTLVLLAAVVLLASCATTRASSQTVTDIQSVDANFQALKARFNAEKDDVRVFALLSPT